VPLGKQLRADFAAHFETPLDFEMIVFSGLRNDCVAIPIDGDSPIVTPRYLMSSARQVDGLPRQNGGMILVLQKNQKQRLLNGKLKERKWLCLS